jgi:hypothetical protein
MIKFTVRTEIARPPADVFGYVTDPAKLATLQTNTISAVAQDDKPIGVGTCVREVHRAPGGKELASLVEVSEWEPDRVFALRMLEGAYRSTPGSRSTRLRSGHASSSTRTGSQAASYASSNPS